MYYIIFFLGLIFSLQKEKKILFYLYLIILMLIAFFRFGVGPDYFSYQYLYQLLYPNPINELLNGIGNQEVLFRFIGSILKNIGFSYQLYLSLFAAINVYFIGKTVVRFSGKPTMSLFLYYSFFYFVWTFSGLRQGVVLAVGVYYYLSMYEEKRPFKFVLIISLLSLIHTSSLILLLLYFTSKKKWSQNKLVMVSITSVLLSMLPIGRLLSMFSQIPLFNQVASYLSTDYSIWQIFDVQGLARLVFLIIGLIYYKMYTKGNPIYQFIMNSFILSLNLYFVINSSELVAARLSIYGFYMIILILPSIYSFYGTQINKFIFQVALIILSFLYLGKELDSMTTNANMVFFEKTLVPYTNIFNKNDGYYFEKEYIDFTNN